MHRAGADLDVERLLQRAAARRPELGQLQNQALKGHRSGTASPCSTRDRLQILLQVHRDQRAVRALELAQRRARDTVTSPSANGLHAARRRQKRPRLVGQPRVGLVDALQPQQPELEVARQRLDRDALRHRVDHRRAEPEQRLVRIGFLRPFVDQLGEVADVAERLAVDAPTAATAAARRSPAAPGRGARARRSRPGRRSAARARRRTAAGSAARSSPRRASCRDRASETPRSDPTHRACKSAESARRWCGAASERRASLYYSGCRLQAQMASIASLRAPLSLRLIACPCPTADVASEHAVVLAPLGLHAHVQVEKDARRRRTAPAPRAPRCRSA